MAQTSFRSSSLTWNQMIGCFWHWRKIARSPKMSLSNKHVTNQSSVLEFDYLTIAGQQMGSKRTCRCWGVQGYPHWHWGWNCKRGRGIRRTLSCHTRQKSRVLCYLQTVVEALRHSCSAQSIKIVKLKQKLSFVRWTRNDRKNELGKIQWLFAAQQTCPQWGQPTF